VAGVISALDGGSTSACRISTGHDDVARDFALSATRDIGVHPGE
jgi:hypothetical protein